MNQTIDKKLQINIQNKLKSTFERTIDNPVIKGQISWNIISDQLEAILGPEVHTQWFSKVSPIVLKNNILVVQTTSQFASQWVNTHYQQLVDALILIQDKKHTCFFISPVEKKKRMLIKRT